MYSFSVGVVENDIWQEVTKWCNVRIDRLQLLRRYSTKALNQFCSPSETLMASEQKVQDPDDFAWKSSPTLHVSLNSGGQCGKLVHVTHRKTDKPTAGCRGRIFQSWPFAFGTLPARETLVFLFRHLQSPSR